MRRRAFLYGTVATAALAQIGCMSPNPPNPVPASNVKTASVNMTQLYQSIMQQQCEAWCWAASISMIFHFYGHPLMQAEIVAATFGAVICVPSGNTTNIAADLSRTYIDDQGVLFNSSLTAAYDFFWGINTFDNQLIVNTLNSNNPLLYCNTHHAMVVYSVDYIPTAGEPNIVAVNVVDPWPFSQPTHPLSAAEMVPANLGGEMTFLASVRVT